MKVFRLAKSKYINDLSGEGAKINGGRWNIEGIPCVYVGSTRALCVLEFTVHVKKEERPENLSFAEIIIPKCKILKLEVENLPSDWLNQTISQKIVSEILIQKEYLLIQVPSIIIPQEHNYILNPLHPKAKNVQIEKIYDFMIDRRI